ncbi:MAG TPA: helix-turn-helix domain-containing protein [Cellulomonas sp.]
MQVADAVAGRVGRRARSMRDKRERILAAATALFHERGFDGVTTQEIADRADVAAGTLFRYAASKSELFLMVYNEELRTAIAEGATAAERETDVTLAVCALVEPVVAGAQRSTSAFTYQRELIFGSPEEEFRSEGLTLVAGLEDAVARRLLAAVTGRTAAGPAVQQAAMRAARSTFAVLNLLLVQPRTHAHSGSDLVTELRGQIQQIVRGFLVSVDDPDRSADGSGDRSPQPGRRP